MYERISPWAIATVTLGLLSLCAPVSTAAETADDSPADAENVDADVDEAPAVEEIIVYGRRRDAELSIEAKRSADQIVDVISSDQASRLPDNNIAESLGRIPGVSFRRSGETGNGNFISIRGLDSALNTVSFDNVKSALGSLGSRRVPLDGITTEDVAELRIVKSLLPRDAGKGIGGTVEVVSRRPLDYEEDRLSFTGEGRYGEFSEKWGGRSRLSFNKLFGERFGVRLSVSQRRRELRNFELDSTSSNLLYLPPILDAAGGAVDNDLVQDELDDPGSSFDRVNPGFFPLNAITFEEHTYEVQDQQRDTLSLSGAAEWQMTDNTRVMLGGRFDRQEAQAIENSIAFDNDDDDFEEIDGRLYTIFDDPEIDFEAQIEDETIANRSIYLKGVTELGRLTLSYQVSFASAEENAPQTDIDFDTGSLLDEDTVQFVPFTFTDTFFPVPDAGVLNDADFVEAIADIPGTQLLDDFTTELAYDRVNDRRGVEFQADYQLGLDFLGGTLHNVEVGGEFERSRVEDDWITLVYFDADALNLDGTFDPDFSGTADGEFLKEFPGLFGGFVDLSPIGSPLRAIGLEGIPVLDERAFRRLVDTFHQSFLASGEDPYDIEFFDAEERLSAVYIQTAFETDRLSLVGGVRVEKYEGTFSTPLELDARLITVNLEDPQDEDTDYVEVIDLRSDVMADVIRADAENTEVLPRMNALYGFSDKFQVRVGAGYSIARPTFRQLGRATEIDLVLEAEADRVGDEPVLPGVTTAAGAVAAGGISLGQLTDLDIFVYSGNPQLDNTRSLNLDVSFEYFPARGTALTLGLYWKEIDNFIFVGSESAGGGLDAALVEGLLSTDAQTLIAQIGGIEGLIESDAIDDLEVIQPRNGNTAEVSGVEVAVNHQFTWAEGWLSDVGVHASVAYTDSETELAAVVPATAANPEGGLEDDEALVVLGFAEEGDGVFRTTDFFNSPSWSANATVYYESRNLEVALSVQHQSTAFDSLDDFGFDQYSGSYSQWDFYLEYDLPNIAGGGSYSLYVEIPDITDSGHNPTDLQSLGRERRVIDEASFNGREIRLGFRARF